MLNENDLLTVRNHAQGYVWHWVYTEQGRPIMVVARYERKGEKTYRQFSYQDGQLKEGVTTTPYPLFGLDSLVNESPFKAAFICEGEKCASLLHQLKWSGLSTVLGAKNVCHSDFNPLRHFKQFVIFRDNDTAGASYAREVAVTIKKIRPAAEILVCNLTPEIKGGDLIDWVQNRPLCGCSWDGYSALSQEHVSRISEGLQAAVKQYAIPIEDCKAIGFKSELTLFEGDPRAIESTLCPVPLYPVHLFSKRIAEYITLCSRQMCIPVDFPATCFLALIGGVIGRSIRLEMRPGQRWEEAANVWAIMIGPPSSKKSPTLRRMCRPITALEDKAGKEFSDAMKELKARKQQAGKNELDEAEPLLRRYITDDCTTPKLRELLSQNPRGLILRSDELKGQIEKFERDGNEGDRSFMMRCWAGLDSYNEDRIIRGSCLQIPLTLTWIGSIQPACLAHYLRQAILGGSGADGFMQRFQMVTFPDFDKTFQICKDPMPDDLEKEIEAVFKTIDDRAQAGTRNLRFSAAAQEYFDEWHVGLENECRSGRHPPYWESHLGKQHKLLAALCIILHVLWEISEKRQSDEIELSTLKAAEELVAYHLQHAQRCYESIESVEFADARKILELVRQKKIPSRFKAADIYRNNLGGIRECLRVSNALALLQDLGCAAQEKVYNGIGKPSEFWVIHPKLLEKE